MLKKKTWVVAVASAFLIGGSCAAKSVVDYCSSIDIQFDGSPTITGTLAHPYGKTTWTWSGGYTPSFKCDAGDNATNCKLCIMTTLQMYFVPEEPFLPGWATYPITNEANPSFTTSTNGSVCGTETRYSQARIVTFSGIPKNTGAAESMRVHVELSPYDGDCTDNAASRFDDCVFTLPHED